MHSEDTKSQGLLSDVDTAEFDDPFGLELDKDFSTIRAPFLEPNVTPVEAEPEVTSRRDPFLVGFGMSFGVVSIAILWITVFNHKDSIVAGLIPKAGESAVEVSEPPRQPSELSVAETPAELPEPADIEQSTVSLESSRFTEAQPIEKAPEFAPEVEDFTADFEDSFDLPEIEEEITPAPPVSRPEPEPNIVQRTEPLLIRLPRPRYPMAARRQALRAKVRVKVLIGVDGDVKEVKLAGKPVGTGFDEAALTAAKGTRWMPVRENDEFIQTWEDLVIEFEP
ncbi:MAG: energy transducer TonB [Acidobacteria bacterium]|nr:energy transducer TonB [Acidobacteriota bacterium]